MNRDWVIGGRHVRFVDEDLGTCPVQDCGNPVVFRRGDGATTCGDFTTNTVVHLWQEAS